MPKVRATKEYNQTDRNLHNNKAETSSTVKFLFVPKYYTGQYYILKFVRSTKNKDPHNHLCLNDKPVPWKSQMKPIFPEANTIWHLYCSRYSKLHYYECIQTIDFLSVVSLKSKIKKNSAKPHSVNKYYSSEKHMARFNAQCSATSIW